MKLYKKTLIACAAICLLSTGCISQPEGPEELSERQKMHRILRSLPEKAYSLESGDHTITVKVPDSLDLEVEIKNKLTGDVLTLIDQEVFKYAPSFGTKNYKRGVDVAKYNGISNSIEGMDERFDEALKMIKSPLEHMIEREVSRVKENTKIKY